MNKLVERTTYYKLQGETYNDHNVACAFVDFLDSQHINTVLKLELVFLSFICVATNGANWKTNDFWA